MNIFMKKRIKDPILTNTRKLILNVNKSEHFSYDEEYKNKVCPYTQDFNEMDINGYISREYKKFVCS